MADDDDYAAKLRQAILGRVRSQMERHQKAGQEITRSQALRIVGDQLQQERLLAANRYERGGDEENAERECEIASLIPGLLRELGLK